MKNMETPNTENIHFLFKKRDILFLTIGIVFSAFPHLYPQDFLYFRLPFFAFIAFEFGTRAGLLSTMPIALLNLFINPEWGGMTINEAQVMSAMIVSGPVVACIAALVRKNDHLQKKLLPLLGVFIAGLSYMLYSWLQNKPNVYKIPIICTIAVSAYFLYRYRKYIGYVRALLWILALYYIAAFIVYFAISRFNPSFSAYFNALISLFPADIISIILGGALLPQLESLLGTPKEEGNRK